MKLITMSNITRYDRSWSGCCCYLDLGDRCRINTYSTASRSSSTAERSAPLPKHILSLNEILYEPGFVSRYSQYKTGMQITR